MDENRPAHSADMPAYHAVAVVDVERFTAIASAYQPRVHGLITEVLEDAFGRAGLAEQWADRRFPSSTGDGYIAGISTAKLPTLIDPFIDELQNALTEADRTLRAIDRTLRMRMRLSIHVGPLGTEGIGTPMNDTHRLLDSAPVRTLLQTTQPDTTFLAAIVSDRAFEDAVAGGYTRLPREAFRPVTATVAHKDFAEKAWLYVPMPTYSGEDQLSAPEPEKAPGGTPGGQAPAVRNDFSGSGNQGSVIQAAKIGHIHGRPGGKEER